MSIKDFFMGIAILFIFIAIICFVICAVYYAVILNGILITADLWWLWIGFTGLEAGLLGWGVTYLLD